MAQTLLKSVADFETGLNTQVVSGDVTAQLISIIDTDGNTLSAGKYGFTIDGDVPDSKEFIVADLSSTNLTNILSISDQGISTSGFQKFHRRSASVAITDWASLSRITNVLDGTTPFDGGTPLAYDAAPALGAPNQIATVQYVLDHANGGPVSFNAEIIAAVAGETITTGQWVYFKESDGRWYKTDATDRTKCLGIKIGKALGAGTSGNAIASGVFVHGLETSGTYAAFTTYYLSDTPGAISTSAGTNSVAVGITDANAKLIVSEIAKSHINALSGSIGIPSTSNRFLTQLNEFTNIDQSQTTQDTVTAVGEANATTKKNKLAQSFTASLTKTRGVALYKDADTGSFTGTVTISLQADTTGSPSGVSLATVTISNAAWLKLSAGAFYALFASEYASLIPSTTYWIVIATSTSDNSNHPNIATNSAGGYASGLAKYNNTTDGWVVYTGFDLYFQILGGVLAQIPISDSTTGLISNQITPNGIVLFDTANGTNVVSTNVETTSYSSILDTTILGKIGGALRIAFNFTAVLANNASTILIKVKLGGNIIASWTSPTGTATASALTAHFELYLIQTAIGTQTYIYTVAGGNSILINTAGTQILPMVADSGRGSVSTVVPPASGTAITVTVTPSASSANLSAQVLDMLVQQI